MIYILSITLLIAAIALITNHLNNKPLCEHDWEDHNDSFKCCKCGKKIPNYTTVQTDAYQEAA